MPQAGLEVGNLLFAQPDTNLASQKTRPEFDELFAVIVHHEPHSSARARMAQNHRQITHYKPHNPTCAGRDAARCHSTR